MRAMPKVTSFGQSAESNNSTKLAIASCATSDPMSAKLLTCSHRVCVGGVILWSIGVLRRFGKRRYMGITRR